MGRLNVRKLSRKNARWKKLKIESDIITVILKEWYVINHKLCFKNLSIIFKIVFQISWSFHISHPFQSNYSKSQDSKDWKTSCINQKVLYLHFESSFIHRYIYLPGYSTYKRAHFHNKMFLKQTCFHSSKFFLRYHVNISIKWTL